MAKRGLAFSRANLGLARCGFAGPGHIGLAVGAGGMGALCLGHGSFAPQWQSAPKWFPWPHGFAYASGAVLLAGAIGLLVERVAARAALLLAAYLLLWVLVHVADVASSPTSILQWYSLGEAMGPLLGSLVLGGLVARPDDPAFLRSLDRDRAKRVIRILLGASCITFGLAHFAFAEFTAQMVPAWLPLRTGLAYATGVAHVAAGVGLVTSVLARLAASLEALMLGSFVVLVHLPSLAARPAPAWAPTAQSQCAELFVAVLLASTAALVAQSFGPSLPSDGRSR